MYEDGRKFQGKAGELPVLGLGRMEGEQLVVAPLVLEMCCTATKAEVNDCILATFKRGYTPLTEYLGAGTGTVSMCGTGPSLGKTLHELTGDVLAVNGALKYLLGKGIVPRWCMLWDADPCIAEFAVPHPDVTYLLASRCHPSVFERLKDCKTVVWHAGGDHNIEELLIENGVNEPMLQGGTAGITRGLYLAYALGYRDVHIFGADSSYDESGEHHVEGASLVPEHMMDIMVGGRWFKSTAQWADQIEHMRVLYPMFKHSSLQCNITAHDDGMFAYVISIMQSDEQKAYENAFMLVELENKKNAITAERPAEWPADSPFHKSAVNGEPLHSEKP